MWVGRTRTQQYQVKYAVLDPHIIHNRLAPNEQRLKQQNSIDGFYDKLEKSILSEGFRNPIMISAGSPVKFNHKVVCHQMGGSRLYISQKHNIPTPCIIRDYENYFNELTPLTTKEEVLKYFKDKPDYIRFDRRGLELVWKGVRLL